jgi:hypothetical protein
VWDRNSTFPIFVTPSTMAATSGPKRSSTSGREKTVSSTTSWISPATRESVSIRSWARMMATSTAWETKLSPDARVCPRWASSARA